MKKRAGQVKQRKPARAHLLIIECDSEKLAADGLDFGTGFAHLANAQLTKAILPNRQIALVKTSMEGKLMQDLADTFKKHGRFRSILLVGHSNEAGLMLTGDGHRSWSAVGNWLRIFEPEFVFLAACEAGRSAAVRDLFAPLKRTLRHVFASPVPIHGNQMPPIAVLVSMLLINGKIDEDQSGGLRLANYILTGGQLFRWRRGETGPGEEGKAALWDGVASLFNHGPWDLLQSLFVPSLAP